MTEQTTLQALTRRRIALIAAYAVTVAAYAAAILLILVDLRYAVAVVNVATLFYLLVVRRMDKRYELAFANASEPLGEAPYRMEACPGLRVASIKSTMYCISLGSR